MIVFSLAYLSASAQNVDSLRAVWMDEQKSDSVRSRASFDHGLALQAQGKNDSALVLANTSLGFASRSGKTRLIAGAFRLVGNVLADLGDYGGARQAYTHSYALWHKLGDKIRMADNEIGFGYTYILQGVYTLGLEHNLKALDLYTAAGDSAGISHAENNLGALYQMTKDFKNSLLHKKNALAIMKARKDPRIRNVMSGIAQSHMDNGDYREALTGFDECLALFVEAKDTEGTARMWNAKSGTYLAFGKPDSAYICAEQALAITKQPFQIIQSSLNASRALRERGRWREALSYAEQAERTASSSNAIDTEARHGGRARRSKRKKTSVKGIAAQYPPRRSSHGTQRPRAQPMPCR
jgi:tetratricopeptide (TPR) repeat protein